MPGMTLPGIFILVGLMGAGKTTVGKALARLSGNPFVDSDHEIETRTGVRIPVIFEIESEPGFRIREADVIRTLLNGENLILATGGGAILNPDTRRLLKSSGTVIYLRATVDELYQRTRHDKNRPLLQIGNPRAKLDKLYTERDPLYTEVAHLVVDTGRQSVNHLVNHIVQELVNRHEHRPR
jgi:shikimate kinase